MKKNFILSALFCLSTIAAFAQNDIQVGRITSVNLGDGRWLFRQLDDDKPLSGQHRIIDGYRSEYVLANFKDGLYDGKYEHYKNNVLIEAGAYKEGRKHGTFIEYFSDGKIVKSEKPITEGKVDGVVRTYYTDSTMESEKGYKNGQEHGRERRWNFGGKEPRLDHNYFEGVMDGKQTTRVSSNRGDYFEEKYFDKGVPTGKFLQTWPDGTVKTSGSYKNGKKNGLWTDNKKDGKPEREQTYEDGMLNGPTKSFFTDGSVEKITNYVNDNKEGLMQSFHYSTGKTASEYAYVDDVKEGPYKMFYDDGALREEGRCERGNEVYRREFYKNGQLKEVRERTSRGWETIESYNSDGTQK